MCKYVIVDEEYLRRQLREARDERGDSMKSLRWDGASLRKVCLCQELVIVMFVRNYYYLFFHSVIPDISIAPFLVHCYSEALPTATLILCRSLHAEALQETVSEGLAQGPYVRVGLRYTCSKVILNSGLKWVCMSHCVYYY